MTGGRRALIAVLWIAAAGVAAVMGVRILAPRAMAPARAADPVTAKGAGEQLLSSRDTTTLIVVAHPDDAEWWAGGTAAMLAEHNRVVLVVATSGEKGDSGLVADLGAVRERLQRESAALLGLSEVVFLREPDGGLPHSADFATRVADAFETYAPGIVITFDIEHESTGYRHVDHEAAGRVATSVARDRGGVTLYLMHTSAPDVICDYGPVKDVKARAFAIMTGYRDLVPVVGPLQKALTGLLGSSAPVYGSRASYPEVGIQYGEVFRRVIVPRKG